MPFSEFFEMLHTLVTSVLVLAPGVRITLRIAGEKLVYLYRALPELGRTKKMCSFLHVSTKDAGNSIDVSVAWRVTIDPQQRHFLKEMLYLTVHDTWKESRDTPCLAELPGLLDSTTLIEAQQYHPVHLLRSRDDGDGELDASGSCIGICRHKSDRVWKHGPLHALCGIATHIEKGNHSCRVLLYDHHGIVVKEGPIVMAALQKGMDRSHIVGTKPRALYVVNSSVGELWP